MKCRKVIAQSGFTLIEIIVTMIFVSIFSAMLLTFLSKSLIDSTGPVQRLRQASDLHKVMANIMADYNRYPKWRSGTTYAAGNYVVPTIRNGHYYKCVTAGTSSSVNEPDWPLSGTKSDGTAAWTETVENGALLTLSILQTNINNKNYGTYDIVYNNFIQFVSDAETPGGNKILKVAITNTQGGNLTALFISN